VGIAPTKTLAKLANHIAKNNPEFSGVCNLNAMPKAEMECWLSRIEVGEIWGVGRKLAHKLNDMGIYTVKDLRDTDPVMMRDRLSVVTEKTIHELNGTLCIELEEIQPPNQQIIHSRSFGFPVTDLNSLTEALTLYMSHAAEKMRQQHLLTSTIRIFIRTSPFGNKELHYGNSMTIPLPSPTDDTLRLVRAALWGLQHIYRSGFRYQKAGVILSDLVSADGLQNGLFYVGSEASKRSKLMQTLDAVNKKMGRNTLTIASQGFDHSWQMRQGNKSPSYTTSWEEMLVVG